MLSDDLSHWFDEELWRHSDETNDTRFLAALSPSELVSSTPASIWPALMPCDFLPLLGNNMGDWLCVRMAEDNTASEIIHWYHGGGDWIPWGTSLAEAVFFDSVRDKLPGSDRDHAVSAAWPEADSETTSTTPNPIDDWALSRLKQRLGNKFDLHVGDQLPQQMLDLGISESAVLCHLVIDALDNPELTDELLDSLAFEDSDHLQRALFDNRLLPTEPSGAKDLSTLQDWDQVERLCVRASRIAPQLAWPWDLLGYCSERKGEHVEAIRYYRSALQCSIFTDQTVRVRTHGFGGEGQKFSSSRLMTLGYEPSDAVESDYFRCLAEPAADHRRDRVRSHFAKLAEQAEPAEAHRFWVRAGWDMGAEPMAAFAELLDQVAAMAEKAGRAAQSELAATHRNCFRDRYGI